MKFSKILENSIGRLEAEYYLQNSNINLKTTKGENIISFVQYGTSEELNEMQKGYAVLRLNEFESYFIGKPEKYCSKISKDDFEKYKLLKGDVLICRTNGNPNLVGRTSVVQTNTEYAYASYLFKIRPKNELINSETLVAFMRSKFGREQINKYSMTSNQTNFSPAKFREIDIPLFKENIQIKIKQLFEKSIYCLNNANTLYSDAEHTLLKELNLNNWQPAQTITTVKSFASSFGDSGRLDAEYYQPKYEEIENKIRAYVNGSASFSNIILTKDENYTPDDNTVYNYIELADIGNSGEIGGATIELGKNLPSRARRIVKAGDVIISSIEGSLSKSALITESFDNAFCSTGFFVIYSNKILPEVLLLIFKSIPYQELLKGRCSGTILTAISKDELKTIPIPILPKEVQIKLAEQIQKSFALRAESKKLLELAKQAVEVAIEQGEEVAMKLLNEKK